MQPELSASLAHGLTQDEPLDLEMIIKSCYSNPWRRDVSDFPERVATWKNTSLFKENDSADFFIEKINSQIPSCLKKFNSKQVRLYDTGCLWETVEDDADGEQISKESYLEAIKYSSWIGPFKYDFSQDYYFFSAKQNGDNQYFVVLVI